MKLSTKTELILYALGEFYKHINRELKKKNIEVVISKAEFVQMTIKARIAFKKERAIYKNLENLEKNKLISYEHKTLELTPKGMKYFKQIEAKVRPYIDIIETVKTKHTGKYVKRQTKLIG